MAGVGGEQHIGGSCVTLGESLDLSELWPPPLQHSTNAGGLEDFLEGGPSGAPSQVLIPQLFTGNEGRSLAVTAFPGMILPSLGRWVLPL